MHYYLDALKKYAVFSGKATRPEFWYFMLINFIIQGVIFFGSSFNYAFFVMKDYTPNPTTWIFMFAGLIYSLAIFLPALAITIRRLKDAGRNPWLVLLHFLLPGIGTIILVFFLAQKSRS